MNKDLDYYRIVSNTYKQTRSSSDLSDSQESLFDDFEDNQFVTNVSVVDMDNNIIKQQNAIYYEAYNYDTKAMEVCLIPKPNEDLNIGDLVLVNNERFFITGTGKYYNIYNKFLLTKILYDIKFYKNGKLHTIPIFITTGTRNYLNNKTDKFMTLPHSVFVCYSPDWGLIDRGDVGRIRFLLKDFAYVINGVDTLTLKGVLFMEVNEDILSEDDNVELNIANYYSNQTTPSIPHSSGNYKILLTPYISTVKLGTTQKITAKVYKDDVEVNDEIEFVITNVDGTNIDYVTYSYLNNILTIQAGNNVNYLYKKINVKAILKNDNTVFAEETIKIISLM